VITVRDVRFNGQPKGNFLTYVSAVVNDCLVLSQMRLVVSRQDALRPILAMPCRQNADGAWVEIYHPITKEARQVLEAEVFRQYETHLKLKVKP